MDYLPLFRATKGLNTAVDPVRVAYAAETGVVDLVTCANITIDDTGRPERCDGFVSRSNFGGGFSGTSFEGEIYFCSGAALYRWLPGASPVGLRSGLTSGAHMYFAAFGQDLFYSNGHENGYVRGGVSYAWDAGTYVGPETTKTFGAPPAGRYLAVFNGRIYLAVGDEMYASEHLAPALFNLARTFKKYQSEITMIAPATSCIYVGTQDAVYVEIGDAFGEFSQRKVANYGVVPGTLAYCERDYNGSIASTPYFTTSAGICRGGPSGLLENITQTRIVIPSGAVRGSAGFVDQHYICILES